MSKTKETIAVVLTTEMHEALARIAGDRGATMSNLVRIAILEWLEKNGEKIEYSGLKWGRPSKAEKEAGRE